MPDNIEQCGDIEVVGNHVMEKLREDIEARELAAEVVAEMDRQAAEKRLTSTLRSIQAAFHEIRAGLRESFIDQQSLLALLEAKGILTKADCAKRRAETLRDLVSSPLRGSLGLRLARAPSPAKQMQEHPVDCATRRDVCRAKCCALTFALTEQDVQSGHAVWNDQRPFLIRRGEDGYCVHLDRQTFQCAIYEYRPTICRTYSCEKDKRIWADFEKIVPTETGESGGQK